MRTVVTGSLAYDYLMTFPGRFRDHLLTERMHRMTVSFLVDGMRKMRGGVAGNIAYTLALLGERPLLLATAGHDFADYRRELEARGVDTAAVQVLEDEFTASCFINTDQDGNQLVAFYAGALAHGHRVSLDALGLDSGDLVVISPTDPDTMQRAVDSCVGLGVPFVFDPGKQTPRLGAEAILSGMERAAVVVANDYELGLMAQKTGRSEEELRNLAPVTVVTNGDAGSTVRVRGQAPSQIPVAPIATLVDPTGAGDAYLAGLVFGMARRLPWTLAARIGSVAAAYAIEQQGCQAHVFTRPEFLARYRSAFGPVTELESALG